MILTSTIFWKFHLTRFSVGNDILLIYYITHSATSNVGLAGGIQLTVGTSHIEVGVIDLTRGYD